MRHRSTFVLLTLFAAALGVLWWVDHARIPTREQQEELSDHVLPELADMPVAEIRRVEVTAREPAGRIAAERREGGRWQVVEPVDAAADPNAVETLVRNLRDLRKSRDAGTITGDPAPYGLDRPQAVLSLYGDNAKTPLASLELGTERKDDVYVRHAGSAGIEVIGRRLLSLARQPVAAWRDRSMFRVPSFRVESVAIREADAGRDVELRRDERRWLLTAPVRVPADDDKAEGLVAELLALRAADDGGFVADGVMDLAPYGLDHPSMTLTITPYAGHGQPQTVKVGAAVPGKPDVRYAIRSDQDDVVLLDVKRLRESYPGPVALRSKKVADFQPRLASRLKVETPGRTFDLVRDGEGWRLEGAPAREADRASVQNLISRLGDLAASEILEPARVPNAGLDPPSFHVQVWQSERPASAGASASASAAEGAPRADFRLGRHDQVRKTVYAQIAGDDMVLAVPDEILEALPRNEFAFRDLSVVTFSPADVERLTVERGGKSVTVRAPGSGTAATRWRMVEPVDAPADETMVTAALTALGNLRAVAWESDTLGDGRAYGLDNPPLRVKWTLRPARGLPGAGPPPASLPPRAVRFGRQKPGTGQVYANVEGEPGVFTVHMAVLGALAAELHDRTLLNLTPSEVERVVLEWPARTLALRPHKGQPGRPPGWEAEPRYDPAGFDFARFAALLPQVAGLKVVQFLQYVGPFPPASGLERPRVTVRIWTTGAKEPAVLRLGASSSQGSAATTATGSEGAVGLVTTPDPWDVVLDPPRRLDDLPADPFAPAAPRP